MVVYGQLINTLSKRNTKRDSVTIDLQPNNLSQPQIVNSYELMRHSTVRCS
jgi:hypothetical protein